MIIWILFIVALVVATVIVNSAQQLFMKWLNINGMFVRVRTKIIAIVVIAIVIVALAVQIFGITIPR